MPSKKLKFFAILFVLSPPLLIGLLIAYIYLWPHDYSELHAFNRCKDYSEEATYDGIKFKYDVHPEDNRAPEDSGLFLYVWEGEYEAYLTKLKRYARVECKGTLKPLYVEFLSIDGVEIERAD